MMAAIVRTLWGESGDQWGLYERVLNDVRRGVQQIRYPQCVYVYGTENERFLKDLGSPFLRVILVDPRPFPDGCRPYRRDLVLRVRFRRDWDVVCPWHYKHQLLLRAIRDNNEVIYCDWDVDCLTDDEELPFQMLKGRSLTLSAYIYLKSIRHPNRKTIRDKRIVVCGNWMHVVGDGFLRKVRVMMGV